MLNNLYPYFKIDSLNYFILPFILLFGVLTIIYSLKFMSDAKNKFSYYANIILTIISAIGCVLANNLILLVIFWGVLGLTLYLLINISGTKEAAAASKKSFIIIGASDAFMILGVAILYQLNNTVDMDKIKLVLNLNLFHWDNASIAWICLAVACFAKAGLMPFHSWIPDCAKEAPIPVTAFLPASLDKLLGIYLLARISINMFILNQAANNLLMFLGAFTILAAVMMALIQHDFKKLLGYHAISQVGYMVLGIGTGSVIGVAGGIFHMINNAIYKSCLFFSTGNVEHRTKQSDLDNLGGLVKYMPISFIGCLIASLSISGVPPFNGFFSKWMIYQGVINQMQNTDQKAQILFSAICLISAMFGSALTLASFMKLLHAIFLGAPSEEIKRGNIKEVSYLMWLPVVVLSFLCVLFGVFAYALPIKYFIFPIFGEMELIGNYMPVISTALIILGLIIGFAVYCAAKFKTSMRKDNCFIGGEVIPLENKISGTDFYNSISELRIFKEIYNKAQVGLFDIYEQAKIIVFGTGKFLQYLHNGVLPTYLSWILLGMIGLFFVLLK